MQNKSLIFMWDRCRSLQRTWEWCWCSSEGNISTFYYFLQPYNLFSISIGFVSSCWMIQGGNIKPSQKSMSLKISDLGSQIHNLKATWQSCQSSKLNESISKSSYGYTAHINQFQHVHINTGLYIAIKWPILTSQCSHNWNQQPQHC